MTQWHTYKGVDDLFAAFKIAHIRNPELRLLVVGRGSLLPSDLQLASELSLEGKVSFAGEVSDELLPEYCAACDFAVLPSRDRSEGFGLGTAKGQASGKPAIGSNVGGVTDVILPGETGILIDPNESTSLVGAMIQLSSNPKLRRHMGAKARLHAEKRDWSRTVELTEDVYEEVAARPHRS